MKKRKWSNTNLIKIDKATDRCVLMPCSPGTDLVLVYEKEHEKTI